MARKNVPASETPEHEPKKQYWWLAEDGQTYRFVATLIDYCMTTQVDRQEEILQHERLYGGRKMMGLTPFNYTKTDLDASPSDVRRIKRNVTKSAIDALAAEIAQHKPRPLYLTKKGNTKLQAKAKKRTKYVEGQFYKTKAYDVMQQCFFDACRIGTGVVKVSNDGWDIVLERVHMGELFVVDIETIYGKTKQIHHVKFVSKTEVLQLPFIAGNEEKCEMVENASAVVDLKQTMPGTGTPRRSPCGPSARDSTTSLTSSSRRSGASSSRARPRRRSKRGASATRSRGWWATWAASVRVTPKRDGCALRCPSSLRRSKTSSVSSD